MRSHPTCHFVAAAAALSAALALCACNSASKTAAEPEETPEYCEAPKPGVITTVNHYCAVVVNDPVNPELSVDYKGQKVGFCCKGCIPRWNKMTDEQKDANLAAAIAKGKVTN